MCESVCLLVHAGEGEREREREGACVCVEVHLCYTQEVVKDMGQNLSGEKIETHQEYRLVVLAKRECYIYIYITTLPT